MMPEHPTITVLAPDLSGGGVTRVYLVANLLQKAGYTVKVTGFMFGEKIYPPPPQNLSVTWVDYAKCNSWLTAIRQLLQQLDGDIIYAIKPKPTSYGMALLKRSLSRCRVALDIDDWELSWLGGDNYRYRPGLKQFLRDVLKRNGALRHADHPFYLQWMEKLVGKANAISADTRFLQQRFGGVYLPNCKDTQLFDPNRFDPQVSRQRYGLADYRVLMFPGTARPHKGLEDLLAAMELVNDPTLRLVIVGGRKPDDYEDRLFARWGHWLIKIPQQTPEQMPEVVAAAHLIVVPQQDSPISRAQFPIKLTDAMAMAKPILATRVGDIPEILDQAGYLVDPGAPKQLAAAIHLIFMDLDAANQRGAEARDRCQQFYSLDAVSKTMPQIINQCLDA